MSSKVKIRIDRWASKTNIVLSSVIFLSLISFACQGGGKTAVNLASPTQTPEKIKDDFQENLNSVQRAGFDFIFAFRRPDGDVFSSDDKKFLKDNSPPETNQWLLTEDEKVVVAGSNYKFMPEHLETLRKRFTVEDYSKKIDESNSNINSNSNSISVK